MRPRFLLALLAIVVLAVSSRAAVPRITRTSPTGVMPGAAIEVTFSGENLGEAMTLWTSFSCESARLKNSSSEAIFRITVASNVPPQLGLVRLVTTNNLSDLHFILVDDLRSTPKRDARKVSPQLISPGIAIDGTTDEMQLDYFTFKAKKNEELSFELFARRIGSTLDPIIRLLDPRGNELIYSLQNSEPNGDPRFRFKAPATGNYTLELRDVSYHGSANYFYRLRVGHFPLITASFPPVVQRDTHANLKLIGPQAELTRRSPAVEQGVAAIFSAAFHSAVKAPDNSGSGFTAVLKSELPQLLEAEPNDKTNQATRIKIPASLNGRFEKPRDRDYYEFDVAKDDRLIFTGLTRSLGCPCDLAMRLFDTNGTQMAESSNTGASEGNLTNTFEKAGTYHLLVEELTGAAAPDFVYYIDVKRQAAGFALSIESDKAERSTNGFFTLNVSCTRDRYDGPVKLAIVGLESCALENALIDKKKTNVTLRIKLPEGMGPGQVAVARIRGEATVRDQPFTTIATTMPALHKAFPMLLYPPPQFDGLVWLGPKEK